MRGTATSARCRQARQSSHFRAAERAWGIQFHAEVTREDAEGWIEDFRSDPDALEVQLDWQRLRAQTGASIVASNELGRGICRRFLDAATRA